MDSIGRPHIILVVARGEAVRNFLYSDTLPVLSRSARVTLLSAISDRDTLNRVDGQVDRIIPLERYSEQRVVTEFRYILHMAHYRWLRYKASQYHWSADFNRAQSPQRKIKLSLLKGLALPLANRSALEKLTSVERDITWRLRSSDDFVELFEKLQPDLVFNCSHIHGPLADLPMRAAYRLGYRTAAFLFSWDNLYSRSRIFVPYDNYLVWTESIREHFLEMYPQVSPNQVFVTGTPQFDFHFKPEFHLSREELCAHMGIDPTRPYILYTTGYTVDFPEEHKILKGVIRFIQGCDLRPKPQLVVRVYRKGSSPEMDALSRQSIPDVVFPAVQWDDQWYTPMYDDLYIYTNQLRHASLGINAASTVTLEMMMLDKPVINLAFEPPGSNLAHWTRFSRHVEYEHYQPVIDSCGVMLARSMEDLYEMIYTGMTEPNAQQAARKQFIESMFGGMLDGQSGKRVAETLLMLATQSKL